MQVIEYKILPKYYYDVFHGYKDFELRKDDRNVRQGDIIILMEHDGTCFTGRKTNVIVKYVLRDVEDYGLMSGYCIIGFRVLKHIKDHFRKA